MLEKEGEGIPQSSPLMKAIQLVQQECGIIGKDANNPFHKSKYASLEHIWERIIPLLAKHGLTVIQPPINGPNGWAGCKTIVIHNESGESIGSELVLPLAEKGLGAQAVGSCISYARRYSLTAILGIVVGDEDDDGESAEGRSGSPAKASGGRGRGADRGSAGAPAATPAVASAAPAAPKPVAASVEQGNGGNGSPPQGTSTLPARKALVIQSFYDIECKPTANKTFTEAEKVGKVTAWFESALGRPVEAGLKLKSEKELEVLEKEIVKLKAFYDGSLAEKMKEGKV